MKNQRGGAGRGQGRKPTPTDQKPQPLTICISPGDLERFQALVKAGDRSKLIAAWIRAYTVARGETDRLLAQSPVAARLLDLLQSLPEDLARPDLEAELESLLVAQISLEVKIEKRKEASGCTWIV